MIVREWLKSNHEIDKEIDTLNSEMQSESEIVGSNEYLWSVKKKIRDLYKAKSNVLEMINKVEDSILRTLLIERYINNKKWDDVADSIGYGWSQTHRLHKKALDSVYRANKTEFDGAF